MRALKCFRYRVANITALLFGFIPLALVLALLAIAGRRTHDTETSK